MTYRKAMERIEDIRFAVREEMQMGSDLDQLSTSLICTLNVLSDLLAALDEKDRESGS